MKAIVCREIADDISTVKLEEVALPPLGPHDAHVRLRAAAVNFPDILTIQGTYQHKPELPFTPGTEGAGDVIAIGDAVTTIKIGARVIVGGLGAMPKRSNVAPRPCASSLTVWTTLKPPASPSAI